MIVIDIIVTLVVYLGFPIFYRAYYGKVEMARAKKLALYNALVGFGIFTAFYCIVSGTLMLASLPTAVLYYLVGRTIMREKPQRLDDNDVNIVDNIEDIDNIDD